HGGGLTRAVGTEEPQHLPGTDLEADIVHRGQRVVAFGQLLGLDHDISARKPLTSVRGGIAPQSCPSRVSLSRHGGTAEYRGIVGASRPVVEVRHGTLTRSARSNNRCSPTRK